MVWPAWLGGEGGKVKEGEPSDTSSGLVFILKARKLWSV